MTDPNPSSHYYEGQSGVSYFQGYQDPLATGGTFLNVPLFRPFVGQDDTLVDFACGSGQLLQLLHAGRKVGIEINATAAAAARRASVEVLQRIEELPDGFADVVISNHGLEHTLDPYRVLCELRRGTRRGGQIVLVLPNDTWWAGRSYRRGDVNHHLFTWTPLLLGNLLEDAGWTVRAARLVWHAWPPRYYAKLRHFPEPVAQALCRATSLVRLSPLTQAVAVKRS